MDSNDVVFLWVDVETDGLDPHAASLLEIAMVATGPDLTRLDDGFTTVVAYRGEPSAFIQAMHGPNGLLDACRAPDAPTPAEAARAARAYVARWLARARIVPAGSTVRFDRAMLDAFDPLILDGCSHRSLDVSGLREAFQAWNPTIGPDLKPSTDHRSPHCLADSLRYARAWRRLICSIG